MKLQGVLGSRVQDQPVLHETLSQGGKKKLGMVAYVFDHSMQGTEASGPLWVKSHPVLRGEFQGLHSEILSQRNNNVIECLLSQA